MVVIKILVTQKMYLTQTNNQVFLFQIKFVDADDVDE